MNDPKAPIAVLDSGVGGLSFLQAAQKALPGENFIYYADLAFAPYGEKSPAELCERLTGICERELRQAKALVLACNTATSAAAGCLRQTFPEFPIIGMEPAIRLAAKAGEKNTVVLATPLTARGENTRRLAADNAGQMRTLILPCPGLMELVENRENRPASEIQAAQRRYLHEKLDAPLAAGSRAAVLGCTHYIFLRPLLAAEFPELRLYDGNAGTLNHLCDVLGQRQLLQPASAGGQVEYLCSDPQTDFAALAARYMV